jgi:hypothetical protein
MGNSLGAVTLTTKENPTNNPLIRNRQYYKQRKNKEKIYLFSHPSLATDLQKYMKYGI